MKKLTLIIIASVLMCLSFDNSPVNIGDSVPDFTATDDQGHAWKLSDHLRVSYLVIYFYPAAFTEGCTTQACSYRDLNKEMAMLNASVIGISGDEPKNLAAFKKYHNLNFTLLSDQNGDIARIFGVPVNEGGMVEKELDGQIMQLDRRITISRWTFVIDNNDKLIYKSKDVDASADSQAVLEFIRIHNQRKSCR